jgi:hypothetical protein
MRSKVFLVKQGLKSLIIILEIIFKLLFQGLLKLKLIFLINRVKPIRGFIEFSKFIFHSREFMQRHEVQQTSYINL